MKKVLFLLITTSFFAQRTEESIKTKKIGTRTFTVITPPSYETNPEKKYPTLVLLDGEYLLDPFDGVLSERHNCQTSCKNMIYHHDRTSCSKFS